MKNNVKKTLALVAAILNCITVITLNPPSLSVKLLMEYLRQISAACGLGVAGTDVIDSLIQKSKEMYAGLKLDQVKKCIDEVSPCEKHRDMLLKLARIILASPDRFFLCLRSDEYRKELISMLPDYNLSDVSALCTLLPSLLAKLQKNEADLPFNYSDAIKKSQVQDKEFLHFQYSLLRTWTVEAEFEELESKRNAYLYDTHFRSSSIDFVKDEFVSEAFSAFLDYDYIETVKRIIRKYNERIKGKSNGSNKYQIKFENTVNDDTNYIGLINTIHEALEIHKQKLPKKAEFNKLFSSLCREIDNSSFQNCFLVTGYYGSGKTRLSLELAHSYFTSNMVFKYININRINSKDDLITSVNEANNHFMRFQNAANEVDKTGRKGKLVLILDDIQLLATKLNTSFNDLTSVIEQYSFSRIKWLLLLQTDYLKMWEKNQAPFTEKHYFVMPREISDSVLLGKWLDIWQRNKTYQVVDRILKKHCPQFKWTWKDKVENTCFYGPLMASVIVANENQTHTMSFSPQQKRNRSKKVSFANFCKMYSDVLIEENAYRKELLEQFVPYCWSNKSLSILARDDNGNHRYELVNRGLARFDEVKKDLFWGIPDMVWAFESIETATDEIVNDIKSNQLKLLEKTLGSSDYVHQVVFLVFCKKFDEMERVELVKNEIKKLNSSALFNLYSQYDAYGRNDTIKMILDNFIPDDKSHVFDDIMFICHMGGLPYTLLQRIIYTVTNYFHNSGIKSNLHFFNQFEKMIQASCDSYSEEQILVLLNDLHHFEEHLIQYASEQSEDESKALRNTFSSCVEHIGRSLAQTVSNRVFLVNGNTEQKTIKLLNNSAAKYDAAMANSIPQPGNRKVPNCIWDYYIEYLCDEIINHKGCGAFQIFDHVQWYDFSKEPSKVRQRRNQLYTLSVGYCFRMNKDQQYIEEYKNRIISLSNSIDFGKKRLALFMMVHAGQKINQYKSEKEEVFKPIVQKMLDDKEMKELMGERSVRSFINSNYGQLN